MKLKNFLIRKLGGVSASDNVIAVTAAYNKGRSEVDAETARMARELGRLKGVLAETRVYSDAGVRIV